MHLPLRQDGLDNVSSDVGEAEAAAVVGVGELFVVEAKLVKDGGVDVVDVGFVDGGVMADFIGLPVAHPPLDSSACHPGGEAMRIMIASGLFCFLG